MRQLISLQVLLALVLTATYGQDAKPPLTLTKQEAFESQNGMVILQGYTNMGAAEGEFNSVTIVKSNELSNPATLKREYGLIFELLDLSGGSRASRSITSYVDYDEIASLIKGIDYISKADKSITTLERFRADYKTKWDLWISKFSEESKGTITYSIQGGRIQKVVVFYSEESFGKLRDLILKAKQKLDCIKK